MYFSVFRWYLAWGVRIFNPLRSSGVLIGRTLLVMCRMPAS